MEKTTFPSKQPYLKSPDFNPFFRLSSSTMAARRKNLKIAMFPWLAYGHIAPFFELSKFLAQSGHQVFYISTRKNINRLPKSPDNISPNLNFIEFKLPQIPGLPPGAESTAEIPIQKVPYLKKAYDKLQSPLTEFLKSTSIDWIIHDFAPYWLPKIAAPLGINLAFFHIFSASTAVFAGPVDKLLGGYRQRPEDFTVVPEWIDYPSNVAFKLHEMISLEECMDPESNDFFRFGSAVQGCQVVVVRSCPEFEPDPIRLLPELYGKPVVPVGLIPPVVPQPVEDDDDDDTWKELDQWLSGKEEKSVFFVAFGTEVTLSTVLLHELASGIEKSGLSFIWVLKNRPLEEGHISQDVLPSGFEERVRVSSQGFILRGWAPQMRILGHPSVGGFLTHCGWSSTIEALGLGIPLILFSGASSDLGLVARLMHEMKVGVEIERNEIDGSFTDDEVAKVIMTVMVEADGEAIRTNAQAMKGICGNQELGRKYLTKFTEFLESYKTSTQ